MVEDCTIQSTRDIPGQLTVCKNGPTFIPGNIQKRKQLRGFQDPGLRQVRPVQQLASTPRSLLPMEDMPQSITELIYNYPCCPPDAFINVREFYANPKLNWIDERDNKIQIPLRNWAATLREWSIAEYHDYYNQEQVKPYFNAYGRSYSDIYYSIGKSLDIAIELLNHQFDSDGEVIFEFLQTVYNVCDRKIPKLNSICIISPPSAGKNFFFDAIAAYFLSYGMFGTANKNNSFSWADGAGKRLVLWNEPNYENYHIEKIKELLGGDTTRVHVKYKSDVSVQGVPIIILSNNHLNIIDHPAFRDRLRTYQWTSAPFLKEYSRKLNPLFFYELLLHFKIINTDL